MKKLLTAGLLVASSFATSQAYAAAMECYVDTPAYDQYTTGYCSALVWGANKATAVFRIKDAASKPISSVSWGGATASCGTGGAYCSITIYAFRQYTATAIVNYQDGTWSTASATASFEDGS
ncbi:hypothetical protein [Thalassomonas actiniarum]|uniref:Uncharacterized protein n=1 Tax=Thalassomonas actiniarum TaxID=485447 RepID=A0AAE9YJE5_9GAMM|nr:hypothetical protein [Thalassomonas actiniarum]WDD96706.1 hypothetical protein SG35_015105 [Thalassomonas actiniarum]